MISRKIHLNNLDFLFFREKKEFKVYDAIIKIFVFCLHKASASSRSGLKARRSILVILLIYGITVAFKLISLVTIH